MKAPNALVVVTTTETKEHAEFLARTLLEARLGTCVQIIPIHSLYRWQGAIESAGEYRLEIKTLLRCYPALERLILRHHPYETPEIIALPVVEGSAGYLEWLEGECRKA
ncbi:divalent-cation tolerance protein CutA [Nitratifractor salsuginis]|uniref:CutA1 divalent ion tolerance protein n=1 Tax=Nitratifractor salsuginis (strain DSM 16511 / JCM 12458 / E9I37-1) TaxID=749222 RepID=E6WZS8_NITSE|nr:divalent-cation tolerance protein CutA [Nitratifractor salsuginis]ADV46719.1 CutA1 divalent ion tolerance protein [Nitratifractor salsuginis DSM 16511]